MPGPSNPEGGSGGGPMFAQSFWWTQLLLGWAALGWADIRLRLVQLSDADGYELKRESNLQKITADRSSAILQQDSGDAWRLQAVGAFLDVWRPSERRSLLHGIEGACHYDDEEGSSLEGGSGISSAEEAGIEDRGEPKVCMQRGEFQLTLHKDDVILALIRLGTQVYPSLPRQRLSEAAAAIQTGNKNELADWAERFLKEYGLLMAVWDVAAAPQLAFGEALYSENCCGVASGDGKDSLQFGCSSSTGAQLILERDSLHVEAKNAEVLLLRPPSLRSSSTTWYLWPGPEGGRGTKASRRAHRRHWEALLRGTEWLLLLLPERGATEVPGNFVLERGMANAHDRHALQGFLDDLAREYHQMAVLVPVLAQPDAVVTVDSTSSESAELPKVQLNEDDEDDEDDY